MSDMIRKCKKCGAEKPLELFTNNKGCNFGKTHVCKDCTSVWQKANRKPPIPIVVESKVCKKCGIEKGINMFHKKKQNKDGHSHICAICQAKYIKDYKNTPNGKEAYQKGRKKYYINHKQNYIDYRETEQYQEYRNSEEYKKMCTQSHLIYVKKRMSIDLEFKIEQNLRLAVRTRLKKRNIDARTLELIGCTYDQFKAHIESLFKEGMTWDNWEFYGWHLDHIIPCAAFDLTDPEQQKKCFNYTNLQPLWWYENFSKGAKIVA